ncbi:MAG TPA: DUF6129 family protein [Lamprocystis sp. (in: g-proteobacteria)]|nr:DUF6129 family protein [Lamprocystis sp. (in: g-proteobacteria)]
MISGERLDQVVQVCERAGLSDQTISALREAFKPIHFTYCLDDDIGTGIGVPEPVRATAAFNLYLVDGQGHCMRFTGDPDAATGVVLAELDGQAGAA